MSLSRELSEAAGRWQIVETTLSIANTAPATQLCVANPLRWGLIFGIALGASATIAVSTLASVGSGKGMQIVPNNVLPLMLSYAEWGGLVAQAWYGFGSVAGGKLTVIEILAVPGQ